MYELFSETSNGRMHHHLIRAGSIIIDGWDESGLTKIIDTFECYCAQEEVECLLKSTSKHIWEDYEISLNIDADQDCITNIHINTKTRHLQYPNMFIFNEANSPELDLRQQ